MEEMIEKFHIEITDTGLGIMSGEGKELHFKACEALMLLDILRNEEKKLREMADKVSPIPVQIKF